VLAPAKRTHVTSQPNPNLLPSQISDKPDADALEILSAGDFPARPVEWLWPGRIPLGKVTLLAGDPGLGKSLVALDVASRVSSGACWPDPQTESPEPGVESYTSGSPPSILDTRPSSGSVLILTADDDIGDTIRPRLEAHGANLQSVFFLPALADLRHDFQRLEKALERIPDCRLIVIDPVNAYVGPSDAHFHTVVRKVLEPLARLATQKRIAVLAVTHLRKHEGAAILRANGSLGFVAAARTVWTICRDKHDAGRNLLLPVKNNLRPLGTGLAYTIESHPALNAPLVRWHSAPITASAEEAFRPLPKSRGPQAEERQAASRWLSETFARGPRAASEVFEEGEQRGFHVRTLRRAFHDLGGQTNYRGFLEGWWWTLPNPASDNSLTKASATRPELPHTMPETCPLPQKNDLRALLSTEFPYPRPPLPPLPTGGSPSPTTPGSEYQATAHPENSPTGHPILDRMLARYRQSQSCAPPPPVTPPATPRRNRRRRRARQEPATSSTKCPPTGTTSSDFGPPQTRPAATQST